MTNKDYSLVPVMAAIVLIPQLLFWWLAPAAAAARLVIYFGGTLLTVGIPAACFAVYWSSNLRKTAGLSVVGGVLEITVISVSALLLSINASVRSAVFVFIIITLVCLIVLIPLINAVLKHHKQGICSADIPIEPENQTICEAQDHSEHPAGFRLQNHAASHMMNHTTASKPLPPRNR